MYCCFVIAWLSGLLSWQTCCYMPPSALHLYLTKPLYPPSPPMTEELPPAALCQADRRKAKLIFQFAKADTVQHFQKRIGSRLVEKAEDYQKDYEDSHSAVMYPFSTKLLKVGHHTLSERYCDTCISSPTTYQYIPCSKEAKINKDMNFPKILFVHFLLPTPSMRHA